MTDKKPPGVTAPPCATKPRASGGQEAARGGRGARGGSFEGVFHPATCCGKVSPLVLPPPHEALTRTTARAVTTTKAGMGHTARHHCRTTPHAQEDPYCWLPPWGWVSALLQHPPRSPRGRAAGLRRRRLWCAAPHGTAHTGCAAPALHAPACAAPAAAARLPRASVHTYMRVCMRRAWGRAQRNASTAWPPAVPLGAAPGPLPPSTTRVGGLTDDAGATYWWPPERLSPPIHAPLLTPYARVRAPAHPTSPARSSAARCRMPTSHVGVGYLPVSDRTASRRTRCAVGAGLRRSTAGTAAVAPSRPARGGRAGWRSAAAACPATSARGRHCHRTQRRHQHPPTLQWAVGPQTQWCVRPPPSRAGAPGMSPFPADAKKACGATPAQTGRASPTWAT